MTSRNSVQHPTVMTECCRCRTQLTILRRIGTKNITYACLNRACGSALNLSKIPTWEIATIEETETNEPT